MSAFDADRNGILDGREQLDRIEQNVADVDRDGALNINEFSRVEDPRKFAMYDTNRDGLVDNPEYAQGERITEHQYGF
ncbi:unnamed protein product [Adineta ricciae]|uniref:EF-hand domain-containing protein n=1 Tax=Adineta ricciae TaxID=249248 RepID=A0A815GE82_ADIRI|nr:unnamed protein product [Adineta ricciae]CAF1337607.1 unnamed protein product [Adineta ricciae]